MYRVKEVQTVFDENIDAVRPVPNSGSQWPLRLPLHISLNFDAKHVTQAQTKWIFFCTGGRLSPTDHDHILDLLPQNSFRPVYYFP